MKKVLLVEDDEIIASQVAKYLEMWQMKNPILVPVKESYLR